MPMPEFLSHAVESWSSLYGNNKVISVGITYVHLGAIFVGGGTAVDTDRHILRARAEDAAERTACLARMPRVHRTVLSALALVAFTGVLMFLSDLETFAVSKVFWLKMTLVLLLLLNGAFLLRAERAAAADDSARSWSRLQRTSILSLSLWAGVLLLGTVLRTTA